MVEAEIVNLIANTGFPIAITFWFVFRTEKVIQQNTEAYSKVLLILEKEYFKK